jgi:hypothetical protein
LDIFYATEIILSCSHDACGIFYWNVLGQQYWRFKLVQLINWYLFWLKANHCSILWWTNHQRIKKCHYFHSALGITTENVIHRRLFLANVYKKQETKLNGLNLNKIVFLKEYIHCLLSPICRHNGFYEISFVWFYHSFWHFSIISIGTE